MSWVRAFATIGSRVEVRVETTTWDGPSVEWKPGTVAGAGQAESGDQVVWFRLDDGTFTRPMVVSSLLLGDLVWVRDLGDDQ